MGNGTLNVKAAGWSFEPKCRMSHVVKCLPMQPRGSFLFPEVSPIRFRDKVVAPDG